MEVGVLVQQKETQRIGLVDGSRAVTPLLLAIVPFGMVLGVTAAASVVGGGFGIAPRSSCLPAPPSWSPCS